MLKIRNQEMLAEKLQMLQDYVKFCNGKMSIKITLVEFLKTAFNGEKQLALFIGKAKLNSKAKSAAEILEKLLIGEWFHEDVQPKSLLELLEIDEHFSEALVSPMLVKVMKYIAVFNLKHEGSEFSLLDLFRERKGGDKAVMNALCFAVQYNPKDRLINGHIRALRNQLLQDWLNDGKSAENVLTLLLDSDNQVAEHAAAVKLLDLLLDYSLQVKARNHRALKKRVDR